MTNLLPQLFSGQINFEGLGWLIYLLAFLGGVVTSLSPCSIGLLPVIVGFVIGKKEKSDEHPFRAVFQIFFLYQPTQNSCFPLFLLTFGKALPKTCKNLLFDIYCIFVEICTKLNWRKTNGYHPTH